MKQTKQEVVNSCGFCPHVPTYLLVKTRQHRHLIPLFKKICQWVGGKDEISTVIEYLLILVKAYSLLLSGAQVEAKENIRILEMNTWMFPSWAGFEGKREQRCGSNNLQVYMGSSISIVSPFIGGGRVRLEEGEWRAQLSTTEKLDSQRMKNKSTNEKQEITDPFLIVAGEIVTCRIDFIISWLLWELVRW